MTGLTDLQAADAALGVSVAAAIATLNADAAKLLSAVQDDDDTAVEAVASDITAKIAALNAAVNPPAATPAPTSAAIKA